MKLNRLPTHLQSHSYPINQFTTFVQEREDLCKMILFMNTINDRLNFLGVGKQKLLSGNFFGLGA